MHHVSSSASCSFDKHGLISMVFGKQHQHTFKKLYAYSTCFVPSLYLLLFAFKNNCDGNDVTPVTWSSTWLNMEIGEAYHKMSLTKMLINGKVVNTCMREGESRDLRSFEFESDVPIRFESDGPIRKFWIAAPCHRTINNTRCSTTNFNRFSIATEIYIEFN